MSETILVTGATGTIGSKVVEALSGRAGISVRAGARDVARVKAQGSVTPVHIDFEAPASVASAVEGAERVFLSTPNSPVEVAHASAVIDAAKAAGVRHVVRLSALASGREPSIQIGRWHEAVERHLQGSGLAYTILRPCTFMDNFMHYYPPQPDGNIYLPLGDAALYTIDARDIAEVAAVTLGGDSHAGKTYDLTGERLTIAQAAGAIAAATGRAIHHVDIPEAAARGAMLGASMPVWLVDAMLELYASVKSGSYGALAAGAVEQILGRPPRTFADFARDHAGAWKTA